MLYLKCSNTLYFKIIGMEQWDDADFQHENDIRLKILKKRCDSCGQLREEGAVSSKILGGLCLASQKNSVYDLN